MSIYPGTTYRYFSIDQDHDVSTDTLKLGLSIDALTETGEYVPSPPARLTSLTPPPATGFTRYWWRLQMGVGKPLGLVCGQNKVLGQLLDSPETEPHQWVFNLPYFPGATPGGPVVTPTPTSTITDADLAALRGKGLLVNAANQAPPRDSETVLDVVTHGPFTWNWHATAWFGPAYAVSWKAGDHVGIPVGPWPGVGHATIQGSTSHGATPWESDQDVDAAPQYDFDDNSTGDKAAPSDGSGVIFLIQTTTGYPTTPDVPPALDYNILDYLGDLVLTNGTTPVPYALDDGDGADGDNFLIMANRRFYKRTAGHWRFLGVLSQPNSQISVASDDKAQPVYEGFGGSGSGADPINDAPLLRLYADTGIGSFPDAGLESLPDGTLLVMGAQPDDSRLVPGRMALWLDPTPGAAKLRIRAKDSAGTVVTGSLPLT